MLGTDEFDGLRRDNCRMMGSDGWPALDTNSLANGMGSRVWKVVEDLTLWLNIAVANKTSKPMVLSISNTTKSIHVSGCHGSHNPVSMLRRIICSNAALATMPPCWFSSASCIVPGLVLKRPRNWLCIRVSEVTLGWHSYHTPSLCRSLPRTSIPNQFQISITASFHCDEDQMGSD